MTVYTINSSNLRSRSNVDGIGLASGLHTVHVFRYSAGSTFFKPSYVAVNLTTRWRFIPHSTSAFSGPGSPHHWGLTITLRRIKLGRTPLDEWSARRKYLHLKTYNTHKRKAFMPRAGFEPAVPLSDPPLRAHDEWDHLWLSVGPTNY